MNGAAMRNPLHDAIRALGVPHECICSDEYTVPAVRELRRVGRALGAHLQDRWGMPYLMVTHNGHTFSAWASDWHPVRNRVCVFLWGLIGRDYHKSQLEKAVAALHLDVNDDARR